MKKVILSLMVVVGLANAFEPGVYRCEIKSQLVVVEYELKSNGVAKATYYMASNGDRLGRIETGYWNDLGDDAAVLRQGNFIEKKGNKLPAKTCTIAAPPIS